MTPATSRRLAHRSPAADVETFADRLRRLRMKRGISQAELGRRAETTASYVNRLESGLETNPTAKILGGLADALRTSVDWLLGRAAA